MFSDKCSPEVLIQLKDAALLRMHTAYQNHLRTVSEADSDPFLEVRDRILVTLAAIEQELLARGLAPVTPTPRWGHGLGHAPARTARVLR